MAKSSVVLGMLGQRCLIALGATLVVTVTLMLRSGEMEIIQVATPQEAPAQLRGATPPAMRDAAAAVPPPAPAVSEAAGEEDAKWTAAAAQVVEAAQHSWRGYKEKAWGFDAISPISGRGSYWCRMAVFIADSLSTLWLMGLTKEFEEGREYVEAAQMPTREGHDAHSTFETTIRVLAGFISAYELSGQKTFLDTAVRLGDNMVNVFNTPSGIPASDVNVGTGDTKGHGRTCLACAGTLGLEFRQLSRISGDPKYQEAADRTQNVLLKAADGKGLVPCEVAPSGKGVRFSGNEYSMGALGDSYYEYLLKQWLQGGRVETHLKDAWIQSMKEMIERMVQTNTAGDTYVADLRGDRVRHRYQHLTCFVPGMLMLGSRRLPKEDVDPQWEPLARNLTDTCYKMYSNWPSFLAPEYVDFVGDGHAEMRIGSNAPHNLLRPETAESIYYMWYFTGEVKYREMALNIFRAFEKSRVAWGYASSHDVSRAKPNLKDEEESFWVAETLKYLYLALAPRSRFSFEEFVFNTEAHPFRLEVKK